MQISRRLHVVCGLGALLLASCDPLPPYQPLQVNLTTDSGERPDLSALWIGTDPHAVLGATALECSACVDMDGAANDPSNRAGYPGFIASYGYALFDWGAGPFEGGATVRRRGEFLWWFKIEGYEPVLLGPFRRDEIQEAELVPAQEPASCREVVGGEPFYTCPGECTIRVLFDAEGDLPDEVAIPPLTYATDAAPLEFSSDCVQWSDGTQDYLELFVAAPGYLPVPGCVPCGADFVATLIPHGIELRQPLGCSLVRVPPGDASATDPFSVVALLPCLALAALLRRRRPSRR